MTLAVTTEQRPLTGGSLAASSISAAWWYAAGFAAVVIVCLLLGDKTFGDSDTQWHIATGLWMIEHRSVPVTDLFSHTFEGHRWIAKEWLSQLILALVWTAAGWQGLAVLVSLLIGACYLIVAVYTGNRTSVGAGLALGLITMVLIAPVMLARPLLLAFPVVLAWTLALVRSVETTGRPPWAALPLLVLWANMHGAFTMGIVLAAGLGLEAVIRASAADRLRIVGHWAAFGIACLGCVGITPYGFEPLAINFLMAGQHEVLPHLVEWQSASPTLRWAAVVFFSVACMAALGGDLRRNGARILLLAFLTYAMLKHQRLMMFFGLVAPILAGPALVESIKSLARRAGVFQHGPRLNDRFARPTALVAIAVALILSIGLRIEPPRTVVADVALASIPADLRQRRMFNSHELGGFLSLHGVKTFFDGRNDQLFTGGFFTRVMNALGAQTEAPLAGLLDQYRVEWAMVHRFKPEASLFPQLAGWQRHFQDDMVEVWVRKH